MELRLTEEQVKEIRASYRNPIFPDMLALCADWLTMYEALAVKDAEIARLQRALEEKVGSGAILADRVVELKEEIVAKDAEIVALRKVKVAARESLADDVKAREHMRRRGILRRLVDEYEVVYEEGLGTL